MLLEPACLVPRFNRAVTVYLELGIARKLPGPANIDLQQSAAKWPEDSEDQDCLITVTAPIITAVILAEAALQLPKSPDSGDEVPT